MSGNEGIGDTEKGRLFASVMQRLKARTPEERARMAANVERMLSEEDSGSTDLLAGMSDEQVGTMLRKMDEDYSSGELD